jgi:argininosuccinate synthase
VAWPAPRCILNAECRLIRLNCSYTDLLMSAPSAPKKIVLAYSGGLDTSVIVKWLRETYDAEIVTFAADIGQEEELKGLPQKARKTGASKHYTLDLVEEFARDFIYPMVRANAIYEGSITSAPPSRGR